MDITEFDAVSYAGRVAHVAAAELYGLMVTGEIAPDKEWFGGAERHVEKLAPIVVDRDLNAEALYIHARLSGWLKTDQARTPWASLDFARQQAYRLYVSISSQVAGAIRDVQLRAEREAQAGRPQGRPDPIDETIHEELEDLDARRPEAVEAERLRAQSAAQAKLQEKAAAKAGTGKAPAAPKLQDVEGIGRKLAAELKANGIETVAAVAGMTEQTAGALELDYRGAIDWPAIIADAKRLTRAPSRAVKPKTMSAGEPVAKRPRNRGGRGKTSQPGARARSSHPGARAKQTK